MLNDSQQSFDSLSPQAIRIVLSKIDDMCACDSPEADAIRKYTDRLLACTKRLHRGGTDRPYHWSSVRNKLGRDYYDLRDYYDVCSEARRINQEPYEILTIVLTNWSHLLTISQLKAALQLESYCCKAVYVGIDVEGHAVHAGFDYELSATEVISRAEKELIARHYVRYYDEYLTHAEVAIREERRKAEEERRKARAEYEKTEKHKWFPDGDNANQGWVILLLLGLVAIILASR